MLILDHKEGGRRLLNVSIIFVMTEKLSIYTQKYDGFN
jgi:hypothetical protein